MIRLFNLLFIFITLIISSYTFASSTELTSTTLINKNTANANSSNIPATNPASNKANISPLPDNAKKALSEAKAKNNLKKIHSSSEREVIASVAEPNKKTKKKTYKRSSTDSSSTNDKEKSHTTTTTSNSNTSHEHTANYRIIEIREGDFQPKDEDGKTTDKKYSAYWLSLESEDGEDEDSIKRASYLYFTLKAGSVMPTTYRDNSPVSGSSGDTTYTVGAAFGKKFIDRLALELEYMHKSKSDVSNSINTKSTAGSQTNSWSSKSDTFMLNLSADIIKHRVFRPYVKAGIGFSINDADTFTTNIAFAGSPSTSKTYVNDGQTETCLAWQIGTGLNINVNKNIDAQIEYMYIDRGKIQTSSTTIYTDTSGSSSSLTGSPYTGKIRDNVVTLGLKFKL